MIHRINRLITIFMVVAAALYVVLLNRESITIFITPKSKISANAGAVLIGVYALGILTTAVVAVFFGIKAYFRERGWQYRERQHRLFFDGMLKARSQIICGEWDKAKRTWEDLIRRDSTNVIARLELSRALEGQGELREALQVLDAARASDPKNIEVLFRAAQLNRALNNKTAAIDNLALILCHYPNRRAIMLARDLSEELDRIEDALEYEKQLDNFEYSGEERQRVLSRLEFRRVSRDFADDSAKLLEALRSFHKRHPDVVPALHKLSKLEAERGRVEEAAQCLIKAAKVSGLESYWNEAIKLWLTHHMPERALSAARSAAKEARGEFRLQAELNLIRLYLALNMLEEGRRALDNFSSLAQAEQVSVSTQMASKLTVLRGLLFHGSGNFREASELWNKMSEQNFDLSVDGLEKKAGANGDAPSPTLSTP